MHTSDVDLRVAILVRYFTVGGLERVVTSLANALAQRGCDVRVIVLNAGKRNALLTELDERIGISVLQGSPIRRLRQLSRLTKSRVVHINFGDGRLLPLVRAIVRKQPTVVTCHSVYSHKRTGLINKADQFWSTKVQAVVAVSDAVREFCDMEVGIPPEKIVVIPNGIDLERIGKLSRTSAQQPGITAISLASLYPHKNQDVLLSGFARACEVKASAMRLRMIGDGPELINLHLRARDLGVAGAVDWYGAVWRRDQVIPLLCSAQVFVSASRYEGMPISVLEAMACGLPLILSDIAPHREIAGDAAIYFDPDDQRSLGEALLLLANDTTQRDALANRALERAKEYDVERQASSYLDIYRTARRNAQ